MLSETNLFLRAFFLASGFVRFDILGANTNRTFLDIFFSLKSGFWAIKLFHSGSVFTDFMFFTSLFKFKVKTCLCL